MRSLFFKIAAVLFLLVIGGIGNLHTAQAVGPLKVCAENPRYFADGSGKVILLTGSHTWYNLVDMGPTDPPQVFDYDAYLDWMQKLNHNFMRLWRWEMVMWDTQGNNPAERNDNTFHYVNLHPWPRSGNENALDGKPKFDLNRFDDEYFNRLRERVIAARDHGIYTAVMLFEGWAMQRITGVWKYHPFHPDNNVNGIDGDVDGDGNGLEVYRLENAEVTKLQETYVKKVIDTINDLDNVLYEISNENHPESTQWQYHMIRFIYEYEKNKPKQHPVGMTFQFKGGQNSALFASPAEWISPNPEGGYRDNPPAADGSKVIINDTDHLWGIGGNQAWVWKSFMRGMNPIFMDPYDGLVLGKKFDEKWEPIRKSMGYALRFANRVNLTKMVPRNELASTEYCLADASNEYLIYLPEAGKVTVDLSDTKNQFSVEWFDPNQDRTSGAGTITGGEKHTFVSPFPGDAVLYIKAVK
ncbi:MAG: hypothetical protein C4527_10325 [Candidatus Omnitrophota bacterium]|jgi:hypothetical protein|nr:MAG: hypothetical protein C4527_10325 [Candidatus Omnitrophota bacterium]